MMQEGQGPFIVATVILGFLSVFKKSQTSSPFEALNSTCLSRCQRDVSPPVQMKWGPRSFSWVSIGYSDIPSSCEMKDEPALKPLLKNTTFFRVRASRFPFDLRQQTQGPSHRAIAEGTVLLKCLWKVGLSLQSESGNQLSSRENMGCMELYSSCCAEIGVHLDLRWVSLGISGVA